MPNYLYLLPSDSSSTYHVDLSHSALLIVTVLQHLHSIPSLKYELKPLLV